jgi:hypothetical protein
LLPLCWDNSTTYQFYLCKLKWYTGDNYHFGSNETVIINLDWDYSYMKSDPNIGMDFTEDLMKEIGLKWILNDVFETYQSCVGPATQLTVKVRHKTECRAQTKCRYKIIDHQCDDPNRSIDDLIDNDGYYTIISNSICGYKCCETIYVIEYADIGISPVAPIRIINQYTTPNPISNCPEIYYTKCSDQQTQIPCQCNCE